MENYTFEQFWEDLNNGFQIYYKYMENQYLIYKTAPNCYTQELVSHNSRTPHPRVTMVTLKKIQELFPFMEEMEYKV